MLTKKDGPNKGRHFFKCQKGPGCNFFQWADVPLPPNIQPAASNASNFRNYGGNSSNAGSNDSGRAKRKCGICKQEGHTRQKCPRRMDFN